MRLNTNQILFGFWCSANVGFLGVGWGLLSQCPVASAMSSRRHSLWFNSKLLLHALAAISTPQFLQQLVIKDKILTDFGYKERFLI